MTTDQIIFNTAIADGIPENLALLIVAQARHETGNYQHRFFTVGKNAFGYSYYPPSEWQLNKGGPFADNGVKIAQYRTVQDSTHELTHWIFRRQNEKIFPASLESINTPEQYAQLLKQGKYYQDTILNYTAGLINWLRQMGTSIVLETGAGAVTVLIIFLLFAFRKKIFPK